MATLPAANYMTDPARLTSELKLSIEAQRSFIEQQVGGFGLENLTIAATAVTPTKGTITVDTSGGGATDNLDHIAVTNFSDGSLLLVRQFADARVVTVRHAQGGSGQISLLDGANRSLLSSKTWLLLKLISTTWTEVDMFYADQKSAFASHWSLLPLGGGALTGPLILAADPTAGLGAATKQYVDANNGAPQLTNRTGTTLSAGDVVGLDTANDLSVVLADVLSTTQPLYIAATSIVGVIVGQFASRGAAIALITGPVTRGHWLRKSTVSKALEDTGLAATAPPPAGAVAIAEATGTGPTTIPVTFFGTPYAQGLVDPETSVLFYEDFTNGDFNGSAGSGTIIRGTYPWKANGGTKFVDSVGGNGIIIVNGDGANNGFLEQCAAVASASRPWNTSKNLEVRVRFNQAQAGAQTRRIGLMDGVSFTTDPTNGIYLRHAANGLISLVVRSANVETTLSTGVTASTTYHTFRLVVTGNTKVDVWADGVFIGTVSTNFPNSDPEEFICTTGGASATAETDIDYVWIRSNR